MLVISRRQGETILMSDGGAITVKVLSIERGKVKLGIEADSKVHILRGELDGNPTGRERIKQTRILEGEEDAKDTTGEPEGSH